VRTRRHLGQSERGFGALLEHLLVVVCDRAQLAAA
jgi:hypothetical protein